MFKNTSANTIFSLVLFLSGLFLMMMARDEAFYLEAVGTVLLYVAVFSRVVLSILKKWWLMLTMSLGGLGLMLVVATTWIRLDIQSQCFEAKGEYGGDCVSALSRLVTDESRGFRARNSAIFALGQLGDARAYPLLSSMYTGEIPEREPLDKMISQYELKKAVNLTSGDLNLWAPLWRYGIN